MDVDRLKTINDQHGHLTGSSVLRAVGQAVRAEIRETDVAFRFGGDEFVVLLPHTTLAEGLVFSQRLIGRIRGLRPQRLEVSVSIGVASSSDVARPIRTMGPNPHGCLATRMKRHPRWNPHPTTALMRRAISIGSAAPHATRLWMAFGAATPPAARIVS
jgi:hypothetical protein